jgi:hypothetical protein
VWKITKSFARFGKISTHLRGETSSLLCAVKQITKSIGAVKQITKFFARCGQIPTHLRGETNSFLCAMKQITKSIGAVKRVHSFARCG